MSMLTNNSVRAILKNMPNGVMKVGEGAYKRVYEFKSDKLNDKVLLVEKRESKFLNLSTEYRKSNFLFVNKQFERKKFLVNYLNKLGIRTPKIYSYYFSNKKYHEIQEKMYGNSLTKYLVNVFGDIGKQFEHSNDIQINDYYTCLNMVFSDYEKMLKNLNNATKEQYLQYFEMIKTGYKNFGFSLFTDFHSGNVMYSKKYGFSFVDFPLDDICYKHVKIEDDGTFKVENIITKTEENLECATIKLAFSSLGRLDPLSYAGPLRDCFGSKYNDVLMKKIEECENLYKNLICKVAVNLNEFGCQKNNIINNIPFTSQSLKHEIKTRVKELLPEEKVKSK